MRERLIIRVELSDETREALAKEAERHKAPTAAHCIRANTFDVMTLHSCIQSLSLSPEEVFPEGKQETLESLYNQLTQAMDAMEERNESKQ